MASQTVTLVSSDGQEFEFKRTYIAKMNAITTTIEELGYENGALPAEPIPLPQADSELFDRQTPRAKLAEVINAAYVLNMPDLIETLNKYMAKNLEGRTAEEMSKWLEIPLLNAATDEE
uniref:Skp1_POZ domain-containing protein n=1 Tax=Steinernema glaseri TaxID=37863 RepID=A0A1I7YLJ9_9BILA